jgi:hypothetical protein
MPSFWRGPSTFFGPPSSGFALTFNKRQRKRPHLPAELPKLCEDSISRFIGSPVHYHQFLSGLDALLALAFLPLGPLQKPTFLASRPSL